jgi:outer membrane immunogenic protein
MPEREPPSDSVISDFHYQEFQKREREHMSFKNIKKLLLILAAGLIPVASSAAGFTGSYAGVQLGQVYGTDHGDEISAGAPDGWSQSASPRGHAFGLMGGYNWAIDDKLLWGIDGDLDLKSISDTTGQIYNGGTPSNLYLEKINVKEAVSLRAKIGYTFDENRTMTYVAAGIASARIARSFIWVGTGAQSSSTHQTGLTAGLGMEHRFNDKLSAKLEYRYTDYGTANVDASHIYGPPNYIEKQRYFENSLRVGIAYYF